MKWPEFCTIKWIKNSKPVLGPGAAGDWDGYARISPSIFHAKDGWYYMFYTGLPYKSGMWGIGLAKSRDLEQWELPLSGPMISSSLEKSELFSSIDGAMLVFNERYNLFFESKKGGPSFGSMIGRFVPRWLKGYLVAAKYAMRDRLGRSMALTHAEGRKIWAVVSDELSSWDMSKTKVVLDVAPGRWDSKGVFSPRVFRFEDRFFLAYGGSDGHNVRSGLAVSDDLSNWRRWKDNPILDNGKNGAWDQNHSMIVDIVRLEDGYASLFEGEDRSNRYSVGIAFSPDMMRWEKDESNPILMPGPRGAFDERMVCSPHIIERRGRYYLFYTGHNRGMRGSCCVAVSN